MGCGNSTANTAAHPPAAAAYAAPANGAANAEADRTGAPAGAAPAAAEGSHNVGETSQTGSQRRRGDASKRLTLPMHSGGGSSGNAIGGVGTTALTGLIKDQQNASDVETGGGGGGISSRRESRRGSRRGSPPGSARRHHHSDGSNSVGTGSLDHAAHDHTDVLVSIPFFESLDKKAIKKLRDAFRRRKYNAGDWVTRASGAAAQAQAQPESTISAQPDAAANAAGAIATATAPAVKDDAHDEFFVIISGSVQLSVPVFTSKTAPAAPSALTTVNANERPDPLALPGLQVEDVVLAVLKDGQWFGVEALVADSFQRCNVRALDSTVLLSISRQEFRDFSAGVESMSTNIADVVSNTKISLRSLPFFSTIDELKLQQLSQLLEFRRFQTGEILMREGEPGDGFIVVVTGTANITVLRSQDGGMSHSAFLLSTLSRGEHWGETALLAQGPRVATVTATSPMLCLFLSAQRFKQFERLAPEVFSEAFNSISKNRTSQLLKTIPLFDVLCLSTPPEPAAHMPLQPAAAEASAVAPRPPASASGAPAYDEQKLSLLASLFEYRAYAKDTVVFLEGDRADCLYIIVRGAVEVSAVVETGVVILNRLKQSDYFGEISLLFPTVRSATITTREPCLLLCLAAAKFARFLSIAPELRASMEFSIGPRVASIIENIPFFRSEIKENKPWSKLGLLGELCSFEKREENEVLFRQGDSGEKFYVIVAGAVLVTKTEEQPAGMINLAADDAAHARQGSRDHRASHVPSSPAASVPGVILRRGNYFGEDCLITSKPRWGTVTALALSVFLTLTKANFEKYVKIAPELRELLIKRQQLERPDEGEDAVEPAGKAAATASSGAGSSRMTRQQSTRQIAAVASNQSLESSPIFDTHADAEFRPSPSVAAQHPELHRLATVASTPAPRRTLGLGRGGAPLATLPAGLTPIAGGSPLDRPALGRPGSLSVHTLGAGISSAQAPPNGSPTAAAGSPTAAAASSSLSPTGRPAKLAQLAPARSTMARFGEGSGGSGGLAAESSSQGYALAPIGSSSSGASKQHRPSVIAKELQAYEAQNVRTS